MVVENRELENIRATAELLLRGLGAGLLSQVSNSGDPLGFGYGDRGTVVQLSLTEDTMNDYSAILSVMKLRRIFGAPKILHEASFRIKRIQDNGGDMVVTVEQAVKNLGDDALELIARSKEPVTFTVTAEGRSKQIEVILQREKNGGYSPVVFVD